jgi:hypothetical protein
MKSKFETEIEGKLRSFLEREKRRDGLIKFFRFLFVAFASSLFIIILENIFFFEPEIKTTLIFSFFLLLLIYLFFSTVLPIIKDFIQYASPNYVSAALRVGYHFPELKDDLSNAIQLLSDKDDLYSKELIHAAFERAYNKSINYDFNSIVDFSSFRKIVKNISVFIILFLMLIIFIPELNFSAHRLINYSKNFSPPPKFYFQVHPGNKEITRGESLKIIITVVGEQPKEISLALKSEEESEFVNKKLIADSISCFNYEISSVDTPFEYYVFSENIESEMFNISVVSKPILKNIKVVVTPPSYTKQPQIIQQDNGNISLLPGSKVLFEITSSRELSKAETVFSDGAVSQMNISGISASLALNILSERDYFFNIADKDGIKNDSPISYSIKLLQDEHPSISLISPNENVILGTESKIALISQIRDDFGFNNLTLNYKLQTSKYRSIADNFSIINLPFRKDYKEDDVYFTWDLAQLILAEGETIVYYLEVFDNDNIRGPKSARTNYYTIQVPSIQELFARAEGTQQAAEKDLTETLKDAEQLSKELQKISDDLKQNSQDVSWHEKEKIEKASEKFKDLSNRAEEIASKLNEMQNELMKNNLISEETLQKYNELQKLLEQFNSEELREAFKRMQNALQTLLRDQVQMSLEDLKANEEYFRKSIERTLNLLKRIQIEQKVDELVKLSEKLQNNIEEQIIRTEKSNITEKSMRETLSARQNNITEELQNIANEMEKLAEKMSQFSEMPKDKLDQIKSKFDEQKNSELSDEAIQKIKQMQRTQALHNQQKLSENMQNINSQLQNLQETLQQMNQMQTLFDMMKILDDLITLSKQQEELKNRTDLFFPGSKEFNEAIQEQSSIQSNLNRIVQKMTALSQKTFAITPEMGKSIGKAFSEMQQSISFMQNQNSPIAVQKQTEAMKYLNETAALTKGAMDKMMSGGQGCGMISLMQQLQQMAQQQMNLNQLTQLLNQGQLTQEIMSQMQRLAQQQEMIRKALEQLNQEARESGQSKRLASNLDKILDEMKEVITNLQSEKIDDSLIKQQERILSKLLDAQRSINERDFEKERKSNIGQNVDRKSPSELILSTEEGKNRLRDELMKAIREGYKKDYEELIRKYFEALGKANREK